MRTTSRSPDATNGPSRSRRGPAPATASVRSSSCERSEASCARWHGPPDAEVVNYSVIVFITVILLTFYIFVLDFVFGDFILKLLRVNG